MGNFFLNKQKVSKENKYNLKKEDSLLNSNKTFIENQMYPI